MAPASVTRETGEKARDAALSVPGVAGLHGGRVGEVALLLPGTRIEGIRVANRGGAAGLEVHIVFDVSSERDVRAVADSVRDAVSRAAGVDVVDVVVADAVARPQPAYPSGN